MSSFKETLAKWQSAATPLTPEAQERKIREAREKQREAVKLARARAARYNMTLRALSIKTVREQTEQKKKEMEAVQEAKKRAMKYNMTSRALSLVASRSQRNAAKAFDPSVSPAVAKRVIETAAFYQAQAASKVQDPSASEKERTAAALEALSMVPDDESEDETMEKVRPVSMTPPRVASVRRSQHVESMPQADEEDDEQEDEQDDEQEKARPASVKVDVTEEPDHDEDDGDEYNEEEEQAGEEDEEETTIVYEDLAKAVAQGDEEGVNRAILKEFLEQHAPHRVDEVDSLLQQYEGSKVDILFQELIATYPDPAEAQLAGEELALQKAMDMAAEPSDNEGDDEDEEDGEELSVVEQKRRASSIAAKKEAEKLAAMSESEREEYFKEKESEKAHREKKDAMLKSQLDLYAKGAAKGNSVMSKVSKRLSTKKSTEKRLSKKVEEEQRESAKSGKSEGSVNADGYIVSAKIRLSKKAGERTSANLSSKWAVNVQPQLLRERMRKAGVAEKDIEALMSEESDML